MSSINRGMPTNQQITIFSMIAPVSVCSCVVKRTAVSSVLSLDIRAADLKQLRNR